MSVCLLLSHETGRYEVRGDELASEHLYVDQVELLGQLGLMPAT